MFTGVCLESEIGSNFCDLGLFGSGYAGLGGDSGRFRLAMSLLIEAMRLWIGLSNHRIGAPRTKYQIKTASIIVSITDEGLFGNSGFGFMKPRAMPHTVTRRARQTLLKIVDHS